MLDKSFIKWLDETEIVPAILDIIYSLFSDAGNDLALSASGGVNAEKGSLGSLSFFLAPFLRS